MSEPRDDDWWDDDDYGDDLDDDEAAFDDCGMMSDGLCTRAGSEWCDWDCPVSKMRDRRAAKLKAKAK